MCCMKLTVKILVIFVIIVHLMFFLLEAIIWMNPLVYQTLITLLNNPVSLDDATQATTLKNLFVNQGFYNLFLAISGIAGLYFVGKGKFTVGYTLILFLCFAGTGAGIVLAFSTKAYLLALIQGVSAAVTFSKVLPYFRIAQSES